MFPFTYFFVSLYVLNTPKETPLTLTLVHSPSIISSHRLTIGHRCAEPPNQQRGFQYWTRREEAAALHASLSSTVWSAAIDKSHGFKIATEYTIAQYNSPFQFENKVNEIWLMFDME
ncbi:uncharacterized protein LOC114306392 [Camellia sinensis]|uniref:uncharacterized protein LOC114306392 n=1 Tax=Camellia sinensis TaxID=4442 RepID=UPI001035698E|nr:uncharacterized protein LOC114306392 [Camellia sinensis]